MAVSQINRNEFIALRNSSEYADKLRAAAMLKEKEGDTELADTMRTLSAQLEFGDRNGDTSAIERTRTRLNALIEKRTSKVGYSYHFYMTDEEVIALSSGEVTNYDGIDDVLCKFNENSIYDPAIFGGNGKIPELNEDTKMMLQKATETMRSIGHISLPVYCVNENDLREIGQILSMPKERVHDVLYGKLWLKEDGTLISVAERDGLMKTDKEQAGKCISFGDAIHKMLVDLNLPDHPERYTFRVLPVMNLAVRLCTYEPGTLNIVDSDINYLYNAVLARAERTSKLIGLNCPDIILCAEKMHLQKAVNELFAGCKRDWHTYDGLQTRFAAAGKKHAGSFYYYSLYTALRYSLIGGNIPHCTSAVKPVSPDVLNVNAIRSRNRETIPLTDVLSVVNIALLECDSCMFQLRNDAINDPQQNEEDVPNMKEYKEYEVLSREYNSRIDEIHAAAANGEPIMVDEDENGIYILSV